MKNSIFPRSLLLIVALAMIAIVVLSLAFFGISYVNIESFRGHPAIFIPLFLGAPFLGLLSLLLAAVPRLFQINILVFVCLWIAAEVIVGIVDRNHPELEGEPVGVNGQYYLDDRILGYRPAPKAIARHTEFWGKEKVYSVTYVIDWLGRRDTPVDSEAERSKFLLFFGDSNTFGDGLEQRQTLPYWAGRLAPGYRPYNYALSGWGPAQMLDLLKTRDIGAEIPQREGYAFFFFIEGHIARVIGSSEIAPRWGKHFSHYVLDSNGDLIREGNFATGRPFKTLLYDFVASSNVGAHFGLVLPRHYSEQDYRLTAEIMRQSEAILKKKFKLQGFYVVISPAFDDRERGIYRKFMDALRKVDVKYLDLTRLYDTNDIRYRESEHDYHNSTLADHLIAAAIVNDLAIGEPAQHQRAASTAAGGASPDAR